MKKSLLPYTLQYHSHERPSVQQHRFRHPDAPPQPAEFSGSRLNVFQQIRITPKRLKESLTTAEILTLAILGFYTVLGCIFSTSVENGLMYIVLNCCFMWLQCVLAVSVSETNAGRTLRSLLIARRFFLLPAIYFIYSQSHLYIVHINPQDYDTILAQWDFALFGVYPTHWIHQFAHPVLTEFLQICYFLYFWIPIGLGIEFYATRPTIYYIRYALYVASVSYALYLGYFFMPAVGPCFTLHDFTQWNAELPGILFTEPLRALVNIGSGASTATPQLTAHRNCMPSGHTMVTLLNMMIAFRWKSRLRWCYLVVGCGIIVSTVYLRYHYVVDLLAGAVVTIVALIGGRLLEYGLRRIGFVHA
ncbi:MAG: phosphatase PAP2 family protein [Bacteroidota bacterium]|nr:phosphatase PAP2 family protein [Candidatus Kapabacteria bacterium]MDW8219719.1 phosphatase PAP2 family protein [Bacteroidota bacterium]